MIQIKKTILTLVALLAVTTGAWAQTGENVFQYCYDCSRDPAYPKTTASALLSGFANPLVGYNGTGFEIINTPDGPWKLEYMGIWSTTDKHGIDDVNNYQDIYNCTDVPVFRLYQWNATANEYQHAAYGVVCAYAKVTNAIEHTALFVAEEGWGCVLTNSSHSSSMNITFDEDLTTGLTALIAAATPDASGPEVAWDKAKKTGTFTQPGGNVELEPEYYPQATMVAGAVTAVAGVKATTDDPLVTLDKSKLIGASGMMYYVGTTDTKPAYNAEGWTSEVPTAADITMAKTVYVWYYPVGADSDNPAKTYSDGEMNINALQVAVADPPTYAITLAEGTEDAGKWTISPAEATKGSTVTVTYEGPRKVMGVKAEKKGGAPDPKLATPLTIEAITPGIISVSSPKEGMQFSLDDGATKNAVTTTINVAAGDKVQFYGNGTSITSYYGTTITGSGNGFTCKVYGNIMSLVDETGFATAKTLSANPTFYRLFYENTTLTDASGLLLPATELASYCYSQMFRDCTSLTAAPELPATELASNCYRSMFMGCTALTTAPVLLATTLVESCYYQIFTNCSKLATVTCLATSGINDNFSTANWLNGTGSQVEGTKTVYTVSTANWPEGNKSGIPTGWTRVNVDN